MRCVFGFGFGFRLKLELEFVLVVMMGEGENQWDSRAFMYGNLCSGLVNHQHLREALSLFTLL